MKKVIEKHVWILRLDDDKSKYSKSTLLIYKTRKIAREKKKHIINFGCYPWKVKICHYKLAPK
jgi:hypothetical protein